MKIDMKYFIAYKDENGKDYNGQPWLIPEDGYDDKDFAKMVKEVSKNTELSRRLSRTAE